VLKAVLIRVTALRELEFKRCTDDERFSQINLLDTEGHCLPLTV
jgi:hypothetical protein